MLLHPVTRLLGEMRGGSTEDGGVNFYLQFGRSLFIFMFENLLSLYMLYITYSCLKRFSAVVRDPSLDTRVSIR